MRSAARGREGSSPAKAGESFGCAKEPTDQEEQPRECGEGVGSNLSASPAWSGSSPRMRGRSGLKASISGFWTAHPRKGRGL